MAWGLYGNIGKPKNRPEHFVSDFVDNSAGTMAGPSHFPFSKTLHPSR